MAVSLTILGHVTTQRKALTCHESLKSLSYVVV